MFNSVGMKGKPEYIYFLNPKEGYSFNYITESEDQTEEQLNDPNFFPKKTNTSSIYKTFDGGKNWEMVYSIDDYAFYNTAFCDGSTIYIKIINNAETLENKLLKFDLKTLKSSILDFNFERMGEVWSLNQKVFINSKNNNINNIYSTDNDFKKIDSQKIDNVFKDKVALLNNKSYVLTWDNEIYEIEGNEALTIPNSAELESMTDKDIESLIVAEKTSSSIVLLEYNVLTKKKQFLKEFERYSIVQGLQSNDIVICGFIGNIRGAFTEYDLFYSLDQGKTWQIQELKEKSYIRPNSLVDDVLFIYSGGNKFQKIVFK